MDINWINGREEIPGHMHKRTIEGFKVTRMKSSVYGVKGPGMSDTRRFRARSDDEALTIAARIIQPYMKLYLRKLTSHSGTGSRLYNIWDSMKKRTEQSNNKDFKKYGAKGIKICRQWRFNYNAFRAWALKNGYEDIPENPLTIDRIDNNVGYSPDNCRWVDMKAQANNRKTNVVIEYKGKSQSLKLWCEELNLNYNTVYNRIRRLKWPIEKAFSI